MSLAVPLVIGAFAVGSAAVAMTRRNLIHAALCFALNWFGLAALYLWAGAEFVAFAQVLVYVGAVSMVVLFAVLLTRQARREDAPAPGSGAGRAVAGILAAALVAGVLAGAVVATEFPAAGGQLQPEGMVRRVGQRLAGPDAASLLAAGVVLTVALLGAVVIAAREGGEARRGSR